MRNPAHTVGATGKSPVIHPGALASLSTSTTQPGITRTAHLVQPELAPSATEIIFIWGKGEKRLHMGW